MTTEATAVLARVPHEPVTVESILIGDPGPGEVLVRVQASGVCHTDLHATVGGVGSAFPYVLGHEGAGIVEAVGDGVSRPQVGDPVVLAYRVPCGQCRYCLRGLAHRCATPPEATSTLRAASDDAPLTRVSRLGTFASHALVAAEQAIPIPTGIDPSIACLIGCAVATGYGAVAYTAGVTAGTSIAVFGCGGVGINVIQAARLARAGMIIAVDVSSTKLELAQQFGATHVIDAAHGDTVSKIQALTAGLGVDTAFDTVGRPLTVTQALRSTDFGGRSILLAIPDPNAELTLPLTELHWRRCDIRSSWYGDCLPARDFPMLAKWYLRGELMLDDLVTSRIGLDQVPDAFAAIESGTGLRSVIVFD